MIKAVIIDYDDTLCLTEQDCFKLENDALRRMGRDRMPREIHKQTWGQPLFEAISVRSPGIDVEAFKTVYHPLIDEYIREEKLDTIPKANYLALDELTKRGKLLFLLTSRTHGELKHMLEPDHLLSSTIKAFYYKDNMQYHKPDPRAFDELLKENGLRAENCIYVGDSISDAAASKKAGLKFIASLESGLRQKSDFLPGQVDKYIDKFSDIVQAVSELEDV
jgi:HAD superfamily hydrolase (TIGR01549 family)